MIPPHIWEGVYPGFQQVPIVQGGFTDGTWVDRSRARFLEARAEMTRTGRIPAALEPLLGFLPDAVRAIRNPIVSVLDYGGGLGLTRLLLRTRLGVAPRLRFTVVDFANVCGPGQVLFGGDADIAFQTPQAPLRGPFDVVHLGSSLQYIEDWRGLLTRLAGLGARELVLTDLPAGDNPTYATAQTYYGSKIPCWFFRRSDVIAHVQGLGFTLQSQAPYEGRVLGGQGLPQPNFPPDLRVGRACNLWFRRSVP